MAFPNLPRSHFFRFCQDSSNVPFFFPTADLNANMLTAGLASQNENIANTPIALGRWFENQVKADGPWDYRAIDPKYEAFGNYNYGATGAAAGIPEGVLRREAGRAQIARDTALNRAPTGDGGYPGPRYLPFFGRFPYGDQLRDQFSIGEGVRGYASGNQFVKIQCGK